MKKILVILLLFVSGTMLAQKVKFKKDKIVLDGEKVLSFERENLGMIFTVYSLNGEDELIFMQYNRNATENYDDDDYLKILFLDSEVLIESNSLRDDTWKSVMRLLFKNKVLNKAGEINLKSLRKFKLKYQF
ncbi:hypothetical protein IMCC3317_12160 [Kordia antarctica]|uniref:Uncharacterized protein n=1 Tax=Kordia antarctica TaxID=1218801 RepID=A0A7L4ZGI8_9FLAO|nr:hypothetical protein [Kordia antarctica]QHI35868.1 hypothetical protein IMCC3317_12160 [Kordia antarctica]